MKGIACGRSDDEVWGDFDRDDAPSEHARACPACKERLASYQRIRIALGQEQTDGTASAWRARVLASIDAEAAPAPRAQPRQPRGIVWVAGLAAAALLFIVIAGGAKWHAQQQEAQVFAALLAQPRTHEWRVSLAAADRYRPYNPLRGGEGNQVGRAPVDLAALDKPGRRHALGVAQLLAGMLTRAESTLATGARVDSADELNDRAALAIAQGRRQEAETLLDRALAMSASHPQALWNRALLLELRGDRDAAAALFARIALAGEPGWADEARARVERLRPPTQGEGTANQPVQR